MNSHIQKIYLALIAASLIGCDTGYIEQGNSYIYVTWDEGFGRREHTIEGIDAKSFTILNKDSHAKDKNNVYYKGSILNKADTNSFVAISNIQAKDKNYVYHGSNIIIGADTNTFTFFKDTSMWGQDDKEIYYGSKAIYACDPKTFSLLQDNWQLDSKCAYSRGKKIAQADVNSFLVINKTYAKDNNNIYSVRGSIVKNADLSTFHVWDGKCNVCGQDKNSCYRFEEPVSCSKIK